MTKKYSLTDVLGYIGSKPAPADGQEPPTDEPVDSNDQSKYVDTVKLDPGDLWGPKIDEDTNPCMPIQQQPQPTVQLSMDFDITHVQDSNNPKAGLGEWDPENKRVTLYYHNGWSAREPSTLKQIVAPQVQDNKPRQFKLWDVVPLSVEPSEVRTCKWFTAERNLLDGSATEPSDEYEFDKGLEFHSCSNPVIKGNAPYAPCSAFSNQPGCNVYEAEVWTPVQLVKNTDSSKSAEILRTRFGLGIPSYQVMSEGVDTIEVSGFQDDTADMTAVKEASVIVGDDAIVVDLSQIKEAENKYYNYVTD
jgi:hypothetical protein